MKTFCMAVAVALVVCEANARLGETEAEINARLGKPTMVAGQHANTWSRIYMMPGYCVHVEYELGLSICETYMPRNEKGDRTQKRKMTLDEAEAIVFANDGPAVWARDPKSDTDAKVYYRRHDGAFAAVDRDGAGVVMRLREKRSSASDSLKRF
ncbi:MAG: hypothetical protein WA117_11660 [Verrucomicrobiia bacterium]